MKNRLYLVGGVLLVAAVGALWVWAPWAPPEPVYNGHRLIDLITQPLYRDDQRDRVVDAMAADPAHAVPFLLKLVRTQDAPWGRLYLRAWPKLPARVQKHLRQPVRAALKRSLAAGLLSEFGCKDHRALPAIIAVLKQDHDPEVRAAAAWALSECRHVSGVLEWAYYDDAELAATIAIIEAFRDKDPSVRASAVRAYHSARFDAGPPVELLIKDLKRQDNTIARVIAAEGLADLGKEATNAVGALMDALHDTNSVVRQIATNALLQIDPAAAAEAGLGLVPQATARKPALALVVEVMEKELSGRNWGRDWTDRGAINDISTARVLQKIDPEAFARLGVIPAQTRTLKDDPDRDARAKAANILGHLGKQDVAVITALQAAMSDDDWLVREVATNSLRIQNIQPLVRTLRHDHDPHARANAASDLASIGASLGTIATGHDLCFALEDACKDPDLSVREAATNALHKLGGN